MHPYGCLCAECRGVLPPRQDHVHVSASGGVARSGMDRQVECYAGPLDGKRFKAKSLDAWMMLPDLMGLNANAPQRSFAEALERMDPTIPYYKYVRVEVDGVPQRNASGRVMYKLLGSDLRMGEA